MAKISRYQVEIEVSADSISFLRGRDICQIVLTTSCIKSIYRIDREVFRARTAVIVPWYVASDHEGHSHWLPVRIAAYRLASAFIL